jgi:hypothetical protein
MPPARVFGMKSGRIGRGLNQEKSVSKDCHPPEHAKHGR